LSHPKVYEFAKEIGVETLALMDKIRKWDIPVKSHMAELKPEVLDQIKEKLKAESSKKKKATKKKAAKKKTTAKKAATKKKAVKKTAIKKVAKKATTKKATTKKATTKKAAAAVEEPPVARKTVIRRKKADVAPVEAQPVAAPAKVESPVAAPTPAPTPGPTPQAPPEVAAAAPTPVTAPEVAAPAAVKPKEAAPAAPEPTQPAAAAPVEAKSAETAPATEASATPVKKSTAGKREVMMTDSGPVSGVKSERPRRNIIGKMDLSRVKPQQNQRDNNRPQKTSTRNLRPGFVSQPQEVLAPEPESFNNRRDRGDKKKRPVGGPPAGPSKDKESAPPAFVSSEFKKREIVFQPKKKRVIMRGNFKKTAITTPAAHKRVVKVFGSMSVSDLADALGIKVPVLMKTLIKSGIPGNMNTVLDFDTISLLVGEFNYEAENVQISDDDLVSDAAFGDLEAEGETRRPVVTVMGHVDHGKTTLLDHIRKAKVADGEAGGITQHVGAYRVPTSHGEITFIDTPGHEAFTAMRARGAHSTDIVILVIAAEDGVMPQTVEAINHSKVAGVPIVVAMNKMDKPDANPDKIKQQLAEHELVPEDWGGDTIFCPVSALKGDGVSELLDQVALTAEILELKGNPARSATGIVVESRVEKGRGNVATLLVQDGTLKRGESLVIGEIAARARQIYDEKGKVLKSAGPSCPVEVIGLPECPSAGDRFDVCKDERTAQSIASVRRDERLREQTASAAPKVSLEDLFSKVQLGELKELPVVLKTDVAGTGEAIQGMFKKIGTDEVQLKVIHHAVGGISESDVLLARTAGGIVVGFNSRPDASARNAAREKGIEIKTYSIVYELMDDMKKAMSGLLDPDIIEKALGRAEVRDIFSVPKMGTIAGSFITEGKILRNSMLRLVRDGKQIYSGKISSLRRFKDDVKEVASGFECGIGIENYNDIKVGDEIEAYMQEEVSREL